VPQSASAFLDESPAKPSAASFLDEAPKQSAADFLGAPSSEIPQLRAAEQPGLLTRLRESLSPLIGPTDNQKLRQSQDVALLQRDFPALAAHTSEQRPNLMQTEGALPALFTPSDNIPWKLPQIVRTGPQPQDTVNQILEGAYNPIAGAINSAIASPGGLLTLPLAPVLGAVKPVGRIVSGLFAGDMARQTVENAPKAYATITDPNASLFDKVQAGTGEVLTAAMGGAAALHAKGGEVAPPLPPADLAAATKRIADAPTPDAKLQVLDQETKLAGDRLTPDQQRAALDLKQQLEGQVEAQKQAEAAQKEAERVQKEQQKLAQDAAKAQTEAMKPPEIPKSAQILAESSQPKSIANVATEIGTQTSPFALQGKLNELVAPKAEAPAPPAEQIAPAAQQGLAEPIAAPAPAMSVAAQSSEGAGIGNVAQAAPSIAPEGTLVEPAKPTDPLLEPTPPPPEMGDQMVKFEARHGITGDIMEVEMTARKAKKLLDSRVDVMKQLLNCLAS